MRGRAILFLLLSLFSTTTAFPQCDYRVEFSANLRSSYFDAVLDGNDLWAATGYGVQVFDRNVELPRLITTTAVPGTTRTIDVRPGVVYAGSGTAVHVLRRNGDGVELIRSFDVGATVNDVLATSARLFVATASGLLLFDRNDPLNLPSPTPLTTSSANVFAIARIGESEVLAADGDATVERFNASNGATLGSLAGLPRSLSVNVAGSRIFVSDGQQTQIYTTTGTPVATPAFGAMTVAARDGSVVFAAGSDRRFRALDIAVTGQPVELFAADILPTGGTVNRVGALVVSGDRLYVAAGDAGLITYDLGGFAAPFALRSHRLDPKTSLVDAGAAVFAGNTAGGIAELTRFSSGSLSPGRTWASNATHLVHDFANDLLLSSTGQTLQYWSTRAVTPTQISTTTFAGTIRTAVLSGPMAIVLLEDGSLWTTDVTRDEAVPARIDVPSASFLAGSDRGVAVASVSSSGTTDIRFYPNGNFTASPATASVPGATPVLALAESRAAVFTFRGITVVDFSGAPSEVVLPQSNTAVVRDIAMRGSRLIDVSTAGLRAWDLGQSRLLQSFSLPSEPSSVSLHPSQSTATVLTADSVVTVNYESVSRQPAHTSTIGGNRYAQKAVASSSRLFVLDGDSIEIYSIGASPAPAHVGSVPVAGALDLAVSESALFVLYGSRVVTSYTHAGIPLRSTTIDEGPDTVPHAIFTAGGAPWVSVSRGCVTTGCEERTVILEPSSLGRTAALEGRIIDLTSSGTLVHAIVDLAPLTEIRTYSIADALHPTLAASRAAEGGAVAIAADESTVYALGTRLYSYSLPSLTKIAEELPARPVSSSSDLAVAEGCAIITGRSTAAELYRRSASQWTFAGFTSLPGTARGISRQPGRIIVLTDYSIEIWSRLSPPRPPRRRGVS